MPNHFHGIIKPVGAGPRACPIVNECRQTNGEPETNGQPKTDGQPRQIGQPRGVAPTMYGKRKHWNG